MIRLPALIAEPPRWRLPLSHVGAGELLGGLLADDMEAAVARFTRLLTDEPTLLLWSVCRSPCWLADPPDAVQDVAAWLAQSGLSVLRWDDGSPGDAPAVPESQLTAWIELATASVVVSRLAARFSGEPSGAVETPGVRTAPAWPTLFGLLHNARAWLAASASGPDTDLASRATSCLPSWLAQWLGDMASPSPQNAVVATVARAVEISSQADAEESGSADRRPADELAESAEDRRRVRERWLGDCLGSGDVLPAVILKLARLRQLEQQFAKTLETEKIEALQAFAYGASHEINNPLANISTRAQTLLREETDPERRRKLAVMNSQAFRAHELIADLMLFARPPALSVEPIDLAALVDQVLGELTLDAQSQKTALVRVPNASPVTIAADAGHLAAALKSLCVNSLEALRLGGRIEVSVHAVGAPGPESDGREWVEIVVADTGPGIPPEVRRHLFDPYFSGREAGRGLGLGLSKCWTIVSQHGGRIDVDDGPQPGATFRIRLPSGAPVG